MYRPIIKYVPKRLDGFTFPLTVKESTCVPAFVTSLTEIFAKWQDKNAFAFFILNILNFKYTNGYICFYFVSGLPKFFRKVIDSSQKNGGHLVQCLQTVLCKQLHAFVLSNFRGWRRKEKPSCGGGEGN